MNKYVNELTGQSTKVGVVRYRDVVLTALLGSEAKVTSCLSRDPITQSFEPTCQVTPREVPR